MNHTLDPVKEAIVKADLSAEEIHVVIATGGSARFYFVQEKLKSYFPKAKILRSTNPQETISKGLALSQSPINTFSFHPGTSGPEIIAGEDGEKAEAQTGEQQTRGKKSIFLRILFGFLACLGLVVVTLFIVGSFVDYPKETLSSEMSVSAILHEGWFSDNIILGNKSKNDWTRVLVTITVHHKNRILSEEKMFTRLPAEEKVKIGISTPDKGTNIDVTVKSDQGTCKVRLR